MVESNGARVRVMAGEAAGVKGPVFMRNPGMLLDVTLAPGATFQDKVRPWDRAGEGCSGGTQCGLAHRRVAGAQQVLCCEGGVHDGH